MSASFVPPPDAQALIAEFRAAPLGPCSPGLQRLLHRLRSAPAKGKHVLVEVEAGRRWQLAQLGGRGEPVRLINEVFDSLEAAEWAVFGRRWEALTGTKP